MGVLTRRSEIATFSALSHEEDLDEGAASRPDDSGSGSDSGLCLADLPPEIQLLISQQLIYPDALSLKHTCRQFYSLVDTGVRLKVEWLVQRRSLHLECPNKTGCDLGSDLRFCRGSVA